MRIDLTIKDVIWSYVGTLMSMGVNLLMLPFFIYFLSSDMLGLWYVFASIGAIATLFDFGFAVTFSRNITYCWSGARALKKEDVAFIQNREPDYRLMKHVLVTCKLIYGILSCAALFILLTVGTVYIRYVTRNISEITSLLAWFIYAIAAFLNLYYGYFSSFLRGVGAVDQVNKNTVYARTAQILLTIFFLAIGMGILGASLAYLIYGVVFRLLGRYHFYKYKGIGKSLENIHGKTSKEELMQLFFVIWHNAWRDGAISVCNYFCNQASTVICSMYLSLAQTGTYSIGVQIASAIAQISGTLYNAYQPELQSAYINADTKKMRKTMSIIVMTFIYLFLVGTILFAAVGLPVLRIIKPETVVAVPVFLGLCAYQFMLKFRNCYTSYFSCTNRIIYVTSFLFSAILCVALSFLLTGFMHLGLWGLVFAQIISQMVYNVWFWPIKAHIELKISLKELGAIGTMEVLQAVRYFISGKRGN